VWVRNKRFKLIFSNIVLILEISIKLSKFFTFTEEKYWTNEKTNQIKYKLNIIHFNQNLKDNYNNNVIGYDEFK